MGVGIWCPLIMYRMTSSFANKVLITYSCIFSTVALVGARNRIWGLASMFTLTFSSVTVSSWRDTRAFLFNRCICVRVGIPDLNDAKSRKKNMLKQLCSNIIWSKRITVYVWKKIVNYIYYNVPSFSIRSARFRSSITAVQFKNFTMKIWII